MLCSEEEAASLQHPSGIGAKPLLINNQENNDFSPLSPLRRRSHNNISKQLAAIEIAGNRHPNHRRTFDKSDNSSTAAASNGSSIGSSSQTQGSIHYESLSLSEHYVACLMITLHKKWHAVLAKRL
ncbi:hypothetical protein LSTR_LSTR010107 [Laodelphax striatellus]|uniref:Uncharacterized protein n=1 Tax=Laodelphax striatellus TaxID=195883 RepID=A0A482X2P7_LAOST|nr:hypothetical protein LSTR_LSTR010107 [Laodelphax striatellus]